MELPAIAIQDFISSVELAQPVAPIQLGMDQIAIALMDTILVEMLAYHVASFPSGMVKAAPVNQDTISSTRYALLAQLILLGMALTIVFALWDFIISVEFVKLAL
jgi:hypothetical protein